MSKDLFDETTMTFGEHLEALRLHLFKAVIGLVIVMIGTLYWGNYLVDVIRTAHRSGTEAQQDVHEDEVTGFWGQVTSLFGKNKTGDDPPAAEPVQPADQKTINVRVKPSDLVRAPRGGSKTLPGRPGARRGKGRLPAPRGRRIPGLPPDDRAMRIAPSRSTCRRPS